MANILICDDIKFTSSILSKQLEELNHIILNITINCQDSLDFYIKNEENIDIIFLNLNLIGDKTIENSIELLKKLKTINNHVKVIIISQSGQKQNTIKALQNGALDFIEKPIEKDRIEEILESLLS